MTINIVDWRNRKAKFLPKPESLTIEDYERRIKQDKIALADLKSYPQDTAANIQHINTMREYLAKDISHCESMLFEMRTKTNPTPTKTFQDKKAQND